MSSLNCIVFSVLQQVHPHTSNLNCIVYSVLQQVYTSTHE